MSSRERGLPRRILATVAAAALAVVTVALAGGAHTFARFSDGDSIHAKAGAGVWAPDPPDACGALTQYADVVYGTAGDDDLVGDSQRQVIMGLGGNDVIHGGNSGDCLVGGDGNDRLFGGTAKDVLIGDNGDDHLDGDNGKDYLDGGGGIDECLGGNGQDTLRACEQTDTSLDSTAVTPTAPTSPGAQDAPQPEPDATPPPAVVPGDPTPTEAVPPPDPTVVDPAPADPGGPAPSAPGTATTPATEEGAAPVP